MEEPYLIYARSDQGPYNGKDTIDLNESNITKIKFKTNPVNCVNEQKTLFNFQMEKLIEKYEYSRYEYFLLVLLALYPLWKFVLLINKNFKFLNL